MSEIREALLVVGDMYLRGLVTFEWLANYICDEETYEQLKFNHDIYAHWK